MDLLDIIAEKNEIKLKEERGRDKNMICLLQSAIGEQKSESNGRNIKLVFCALLQYIFPS